MTKIKVGGVPEHFNLPWHRCIENNKFTEAGIDLEWKEVPEGTGAMCNLLREEEIDVAVILTEGITRDIIDGNQSKIIQNYIGSPLIWGIHVDAGSSFKNINDLKGTKAAISREGSGSHLMAYVNAEHVGWNTDSLQFEVVHNLEGAIEALRQDDAQYFMWEHFTTKPLVDNNTFRLIADCPTPWPCFVIAASQKAIDEKPDELLKMLEILNTETNNFKIQKSIDVELAERYGQKLEDIRKWLDLTHWSQQQIVEQDLTEVQDYLKRLKLISEKVDNKDLIHNFRAK